MHGAQEQGTIIVEFDSNRGKIFFAATSVDEVLAATSGGTKFDGRRLRERKVISEEEARKLNVRNIERCKQMLDRGITCIQLESS